LRSWLPKPLRKPLGYVVSSAERMLSHWADATLVTQERQLSHFSARCRLLRNAPVISKTLRERVYRQAEALSRDTSTYRLVYAGGISKTRGLYTMLEALLALNRNDCP